MALRQKLKLIMRPDTHAGANGMYRITSIYFDNFYDKALNDKRYGVSEREKFRFRYYNDDLALINLEKKKKAKGVIL